MTGSGRTTSKIEYIMNKKQNIMPREMEFSFISFERYVQV